MQAINDRKREQGVGPSTKDRQGKIATMMELEDEDDDEEKEEEGGD